MKLFELVEKIDSSCLIGVTFKACGQSFKAVFKRSDLLEHRNSTLLNCEVDILRLSGSDGMVVVIELKGEDFNVFPVCQAE